jgi:dephospho-CoA kinase
MLRVGLTGGIACGKSLVAGFFSAKGVPVVNDDVAARDAVAAGTPGWSAVVGEFGDDVIGPDGELDRARLGRIVFADDAKRRRLMQITFPFIGELLRERFRIAEAGGGPMVVYESALLVENGGAEAWRPLVVVGATRAHQLARLSERNALEPDEAERRIAAQMSIEEKAALADHVIDNTGSVEDAREQFDRIYAELLRRAAAERSSS